MQILIILIINFICGVIVSVWHEFTKNIASYFLTAPFFREKNFKFISPIKYIDPIGMVLFTFSPYATGWQKPYNYDASKFIHREKDRLVLGLVGQMSTFLLIVLLIPIYKFVQVAYDIDLLLVFIGTLIRFNGVILVVNLLPIPPFDMSGVIHALKPVTYNKVMKNEHYLHSLFLFIVAVGLLTIMTEFILNPLLAVLL